MNKYFLIFTLLLVCISTPWAYSQEGAAGAVPAGGDKVEKDKVWTAHEIRLIDKSDEIVAVLPNGMVAMVKENHTAPVAAVRLYVRAGSIYEEQHLGAGLSHLFEHLLAAGETKNRTEEQSRKLIQQIGAKYNAYTSKARTCYHLTVPAQHVGTALSLIADWVTRPTFPDAAFEREWGVVQRELEMRATDPDQQIWKLFDELRYKVHPGRYPVIGHQTIVKQLTREDIFGYYQRMYVPDNCVIAIAGDINAGEMLEAIKQEFSDFTRRAKVNIVLPEEPAITAPRQIVKVFPAMQGPAKLRIGFPSFKLQHEDLYALDTLANIMGEGKSSRLYQSLREDKQLVFSVSAANYTPHWAEGTFIVMCELAPANVSKTQRAIWVEIEKIQKEGVSAAELARAKKQLQSEHIRSHQTAEQQGSTMAEDYLATGDPHFSDHYVANMQKVSVEQVQAMAQKYFVAQKQLTLVLTPAALPVDQEDEQKEAGESEIKKITLDNGLRVLLKRNPTVPLVSMQLYVGGGLVDETEANNGLTNLMCLLSTKGTANYSAKQIVEYFDGISGTTGCGNNTYFYILEIMREDFAEAFDIFREVVIEPVFHAEELAKLKPVIIASIDKIEDSWPLAGRRFFREKFFSNSPYKRLRIGTKESVPNITRDQIVSFHQQTTVGGRSVLAVFGDIDLEAAEKVIREKFSVMGKGEPLDLNKFASDEPVKEPRMFVKQTEKNGATVHVAFAGMKLTDIQDRYPMEVLTEIVGSNTGWLHELLRGKQLVYYAWGYSFPALLPGYVVATAQCEADKAPQVMELIQEQMAKAARGEFTEDEIALAKSNLINAEVLTKLTNADAAASACLDELYYLDYNWSKGYADRIMALTQADVQNVGRKYLTQPQTVTINSSKPELFEQADQKTTTPK